MRKRNVSKVLIDTLAWTLILPIAYFLRLEITFFTNLQDILLITLVSFPIKAVIVWLNRHHSYSWRYAGLLDSSHILTSIIQFMILFLAATMMLRSYVFIPASVPVIEAILSLLMFIGIRAATRLSLRTYTKGSIFRAVNADSKRKVLIVGAGDAGTMILRSINQSVDSDLYPIGFIDDDPVKQH